MSENKEIIDDEIEFDDEIDYNGLEDDETADYPEPETFLESEFSEDDHSDNDEEENWYDEAKDNIETKDEESVTVTDDATETEEDNEINDSEIITDEYCNAVNEFSEESVKKDNSAEELKPEKSSTCGNLTINRFFILNTAVSAITLCAVAAGIALGYSYINSIENDLEIKNAEITELEKKNSALEEDYLAVMKQYNDYEADSVKDITTEADEGKIIFYDSSVGYSWMPVLNGIKKNDYKAEDFSLDGRGRLSYSENGEEASYFGIDVSSYQGDIDWQLVKEDNVEFAFLRIGYRGYGEEGKLCPDENFDYNYSEARNAGIDLGVYFFSQAATVDEAIEEAEYVLSLLEGRELEYPVVFDWETIQTGDPEDIPRTEDVMPKTLTLSAIAFCETIEDAGYDAMIYTNKKLATIKYDLRMLQDYPVWLAYYDTNLNYCYDFDVWQYGTAKVDGIEGEVDVNISIIK